ncbi:CoA transferase, partial [Streptomyces sp. NPDC090106]|uniref:CoA transferase n=1 Tax=Streptomyces sp. NPDC090106 TaxID=3365946 RepID=UPI0037F72940
PKWQVLAELNAHNIPCGPILSTKEIIEDASLVANEMVVEVDHPERGTFVTVGNPIKLSDSRAEITASPLLGEHNEDIYVRELGLSSAELPGLKEAGVI